MSKPSIVRTMQLLDRPVFRTREIAALRGTSVGAASQALRGLERQGVVSRVARGVWCVPSDPRFNRFLLVSYLSGVHRAYVSFVSALHLHGMIEQIPHVVYAATTAHSHIETTPLGEYSFHQIVPRFFDGFDWYHGQQSFLIASAEKALVDSLYLSTRRGRRFASLPELELGRPFSIQRARGWIRRIPDERIKSLVATELERLWRHAMS
ncbi:MAG TPA: type IV toxin-antitoxin system AbiEi family antitoxin domain-containing protein [Vicinamibacteria bacterium]|nr:type IV toxin-antitoxin system AbiEi family antitoxin domain-containing protein [Vicinamibacteria bacterium]